MNNDKTKLHRILKLPEILSAYPEGLRKSELARILDVSRATAGRYIDELSYELPIIEEEDGRIRLVPEKSLFKVELSIHEALAFHLAIRLLTSRIPDYNPHIVTALSRLGEAIQAYSPVISRHILNSVELFKERAAEKNSKYILLLETLMQAWHYRKKVRLTYNSVRQNKQTRYDLGVYALEPYAAGHTLYVIGHCDGEDHLRTFKLSRIEKAELLERFYKVPADFNINRKLSRAWGIWYSREKPILVELKFSEQVARRVEETKWHSTERTQPLADGSLLWRAEIAEPLEMLPWIRGWGADVEIVKPVELRERLINELEELRKIYGK